MNIAVLYDGAGLARLGLEQAGHFCTGFEIDPWIHYLSKFVGSGNCIQKDVREVDLSSFDAIWASPPCQERSQAAQLQNNPTQFDQLQWCLNLLLEYPTKTIWIENVSSTKLNNSWGKKYNANQFTKPPLQNRVRIIGGNYLAPKVFKDDAKNVDCICPTIMATEYKLAGKSAAWDRNRAGRFFGRRLQVEECARFQGFEIPQEWYREPTEYKKNPHYNGKTRMSWKQLLYKVIGNGVFVPMARAFGECYE